MQDFYILQRTATPLSAENIKKWYFTVEMLAPDGILSGNDDNNALVLAMQDAAYLYILPLVRHLTADEAERIVEGYMRVTEHDFEIESSNVYEAEANFGQPFEYDIRIEEEVKNQIHEMMARQHHNTWINEQINKGWRFGLNLDASQKTHPAMRPWDDLPEAFKRKRTAEDKQLLDYYSKNITKF